MTDSNRDILIAMSVHNGRRHLDDQIASLADQSGAGRVHLLVRDDGSTDDTAATLRSLDIAPLTMEVVHGPNLGARDSFIAVLNQAPTTYRVIMLCDQDDVWLPGKVEIAARAITSAPPGVPLLYAGRSIVTDSTLHPIGLTAEAPHPLDLHHVLFKNIAPGHTMAFNQPLLAAFRQSIGPAALMHDWWLSLLAVCLGRIVFDPEPHTLYRQHGANEIGYAASPGQRLAANLKRLVHEDRCLVTRQAHKLRTSLDGRLTPSDRALLDTFLDQGRLRDRLRYLRHHPMPSSQGPAIVSSLLYAAGRYQCDPSGADRRR
ncbi:MAG: glycosyltransferase [Propionibacteriaceae bacterium]|jgi:glycosyltransferase involved in cell wall biosynthesis|nr:glycosyltransferase [Propionibacteriaceae bacterium]